MFELILNLTVQTKKSVEVNNMQLGDVKFNLVPHFIQNVITFDCPSNFFLRFVLLEWEFNCPHFICRNKCPKTKASISYL